MKIGRREVNQEGKKKSKRDRRKVGSREEKQDGKKECRNDKRKVGRTEGKQEGRGHEGRRTVARIFVNIDCIVNAQETWKNLTPKRMALQITETTIETLNYYDYYF